MSDNYMEKFEKMRVAGKLASKALDMITDYIKPGISTDKIDTMCYIDADYKTQCSRLSLYSSLTKIYFNSYKVTS